MELALGNGAGTAMLEGAKLMFVPPSLKFSSKWITPNVLECVPLEEVPFRSTYLWKPAENVRFLDGSPVPVRSAAPDGTHDLEFLPVFHGQGLAGQ